METRRNGPRIETRPTGPRPRHIALRPVLTSSHLGQNSQWLGLVSVSDLYASRLETVSRSRRRDRNHIPVF